ncbi:MAG: hypothetical protein L7H10_07430 [Vulcanisaeta sp.]|nr:hypothetical protein [Vulcanisaeta sp.]MCG2870564.1 hypothetical protein [Vulcanisaeta sp.]MCG2880562.1 hypothetical protein [Vulcanisaeta sp.]MCG2887680.1 hypothetical protein [Vulcanisaeta sp.]MCG2895506.1 hypothetical protein [Vulcanisaeta sp.]
MRSTLVMCRITMKVPASYPDNVVKAGLTLRSRVASSLDKRLQDRSNIYF